MTVSSLSGPRIRKLPAKAYGIVFPMVLSLLMSGIVATIATLKAVGLEAGIVSRILQAWAMSYMVAFPSALLVMPFVRKIVAAIVEVPTR